MRSISYKWLFATLIGLLSISSAHPIYVSVIEIEHNAKEKTLEISCKIFTDDFEKTLRSAYNKHIDLTDPKIRPAMEKIINDYVQKHLQIAVNGKLQSLQYKGYEQIEEAIYSYYQADEVNAVKNISVTDNILYEYKAEQMGIIHITVNGNLKSTKLQNPEDKMKMEF